MKKVNVTTMMIAVAVLGLTVISCKDEKTEHTEEAGMHSEMNHEKGMDHDNMSASNTGMDSNTQNLQAKQVLTDYMTLKDALVATDEKAAADAGKQLQNTLQSFDVSNFTTEQQTELKDIIEVATEHAEHISRSDVAHQREHFQMLTKDVTDMVAITGTENTLYQQFCPMYADGGGAWLSMEREIKNPYFGSKMMKCGKVKKEIN
ncbi:DUF3347 domain-containing protein [Aequorivita xiaoshiensis]|uniref:DUF3347 domain-containing protein n=1 Tax=Aequorivita xiaoshiensis TaxID=2874476 RepID=A0A9X1R3W7_9FLAO|nr:DUF3347 domain-containing protein [Aequorivita xiaoshiensis]MCG2431093.1 DUF3347 domain-containing protein [Aequorivita xiaoshiensis]